MRQHIPGFIRSKLVALILFLALTTSIRTQAQTTFGGSVSPKLTTTNSLITYTFGVTNMLNAGIQNIFLTNDFSSFVTVTTYGTNYPSTTVFAVTNGNKILLIFNVPDLTFNAPAFFAVTAFSTNAVSLTNTATLSVVSPAQTYFTNLVTIITNTVPSVADLAVTVSGPPPGPDPYVGDWVTFSVTVTNVGTNSVSGVVLTNSFLPAMVKSIFPTNLFVNGLAKETVGTLASGAGKSFTYTVQPTNSGALAFSSTATSSATDVNTSNNTATANVLISSFLTNTLTATFLWPTQKFNPENSLMEQRVLLSNVSADSVPSARLMVSGIGKTNSLFNAIGTNNGLPFVEYGTDLAGSSSVELLLQYQVPSHRAFTNSDANLIARAMTNAANLTPPSNLVLYTNLPVDLTNHVTITPLPVDGAMYILFPSVKGKIYSIVYSDDASFTTPRIARPPVVAPGNWTYWIDYGPPGTISAPMETPSRFYKVFINP